MNTYVIKSGVSAYAKTFDPETGLFTPNYVDPVKDSGTVYSEIKAETPERALHYAAVIGLSAFGHINKMEKESCDVYDSHATYKLETDEMAYVYEAYVFESVRDSAERYKLDCEVHAFMSELEAERAPKVEARR